MRRVLLAVLIFASALAAAAIALAPAGRKELPLPPDPRVVRGVMHVHTTVSDGAGTPEAIARAAGRAGLQFVVLTDHGDGTRPPAPPQYLDGVLMIDAVEISTTGGHYLAMGLDQTPYRLAGEPRDVIEDVTRLGGFGVAAHPDSPKLELSWREWQAPFEGIEWLNADSAWRDESRRALVRAFIGYWWHGPEAIASLFDRPGRSLTRWDALNKRRRVVGLSGVDAHARIGGRSEWDGVRGGRSLRVPSYDAAFQVMSLVVAVAAPLSGHDAPADRDVVLAALRNGRVSTVIDAIAGPARLEFSATHDGAVTPMGGEVAAGVEPTLSAVLTPGVEAAQLVLLRDGVAVARSTGPHVTFRHSAPAGAAVYRVEALWPGAPGEPPVPWIVANPIRVGFPAPRPPVPLLATPRWARPVPVDGWTVEKHPASTTTLTATVLTPTNTARTLEWTLGGGAPAGQYAALSIALPHGFLRQADRVAFVARGGTPMRVSLQLRASASGGRWRRSVYLSPTPGRHEVAIRELTPVDVAPGTALDLATIDSLLFVVDTVNTAPGSRGEVWVSEVQAEGVER